MQAIQVEKSIIKPSVRGSMVGCVAATQVLTGYRTAGIQTFQQLVAEASALPAREQAEVLWKIREWQIKAGERQAVVEAVRQELPSTKAIVDESARAEKLEQLASLAVKAGDLEMALGITEGINSDTRKIGVMQYITRIALETKERPERAQLIQRLSQTATAMAQKGISKKHPDMKDVKMAMRNALERIAFIQAAAGNAQAAIATLNNANSTNTYAYKPIVGTLIEIGDLAGAEVALAEMKNELKSTLGPWPLSLLDERQALATAYAKAGDLERALAWAKKQTGPYAKASALLGAGEGVLDRKGIEDLNELFAENRMREVC
jgi:predicted DNA-binding protein